MIEPETEREEAWERSKEGLKRRHSHQQSHQPLQSQNSQPPTENTLSLSYIRQQNSLAHTEWALTHFDS